jgi:hypothetical protein
VFVLHLSQSANEGHYITDSNHNGIWSEYNDDKVTTSVAIAESWMIIQCMLNKQPKLISLKDSVLTATLLLLDLLHIMFPSTGEVKIAGAMVDLILQCEILASSRERIRLAL